MFKLGGSQPDLRWSDSGKLNTGRARMGTPRKRNTAPSAMPSLASKSMRTRSVLSTQAGSPEPSRGQLVYSASVAKERALSMKSTRAARPPDFRRRNSNSGCRKKPSKRSTRSSSRGPLYTAPSRRTRTWPMARARSSGLS